MKFVKKEHNQPISLYIGQLLIGFSNCRPTILKKRINNNNRKLKAAEEYSLYVAYHPDKMIEPEASLVL